MFLDKPALGSVARALFSCSSLAKRKVVDWKHVSNIAHGHAEGVTNLVRPFVSRLLLLITLQLIPIDIIAIFR